MVVERLASAEAFQQFVDSRDVAMEGMEFGANELVIPGVQHGCEGAVGPEKGAIGGHEREADRSALEEIIQLAFAEAEFVMELPLDGDIPSDGGDSDRTSGRISDQGKGERDPDALAVLASAFGLEVLHDLSLAETSREDAEFVFSAWGLEHPA